MGFDKLRPACIKLDRTEVALKALDLWLDAGHPLGRRTEFWIQAIVELLPKHQGRLLAMR
jgi:hypothetical protein